MRGKRHQYVPRLLGTPEEREPAGTPPAAEPLPRACRRAGHSPGLPVAVSSMWSGPWAHTGGGPEAAVCLGGEHFRDPLLPGTLPRVGFPPWQTTDVRERQGKASLPHAHRLPSGQQEGGRQSP